MLAQLLPPFSYDPEQLLALCIWREARGCSVTGKIGVALTILNRCKIAPAQGFRRDVLGNILKPWAFSSFMQGDPNSLRYPEDTDPSWQSSLSVAEGCHISSDGLHFNPDFPDPTNGATFYYSRPLTGPPVGWGNVVHTADVGGLHFYRSA